jgi:hypothetical protein
MCIMGPVAARAPWRTTGVLAAMSTSLYVGDGAAGGGAVLMGCVGWLGMGAKGCGTFGRVPRAGHTPDD